MTEAKEDVRWCVVKEMAKFVKGGWGGRMEDLQIYAVQINDLLFDLFFLGDIMVILEEFIEEPFI